MMLLMFRVYDSLLMVVVRPDTSSYDIHAFTLDYHLHLSFMMPFEEEK
jgi:hypothetical protein